MRLGRVPGHSEWAEPYFEIIPLNKKAAPLKGEVAHRDLNLTIGEISTREFIGFARGCLTAANSTWKDDFSSIWRAIKAGKLEERLYLNSSGAAIGWFTRLSLDERTVIFRNGRRRETLFAKEQVRTVTYEAYR